MSLHNISLQFIFPKAFFFFFFKELLDYSKGISLEKTCKGPKGQPDNQEEGGKFEFCCAMEKRQSSTSTENKCHIRNSI